MFKKGLWRSLAATLSAIFVVGLCFSLWAFDSRVDIDFALGTSSVRIVGGVGESQHFTRRTDDIADFMTQQLELLERINDEATVLLKNANNTLPLAGGSSVTLVGTGSRNPVRNVHGVGGIGNIGNDSINLTFRDGLENAGLSVNPTMWNWYDGRTGNNTAANPGGFATANTWLNALPLQAMPGQAQWDSVVDYDDAIIVFLSRGTGENNDRGRDYFQISATERALVNRAIAEDSNNGNVILVVNSSTPMQIGEFYRNAGIGAILIVGEIGSRGANSLGNILVGNVNPSGRTNCVCAVYST